VNRGDAPGGPHRDTPANDTDTPVMLTNDTAPRYGWRNALAGRRWCRAHGVPLYGDRKGLWLLPSELRAAIRSLPNRGGTPPSPPPAPDANVAAIVATMKGAK
jgi:hypothetical protein